GQRLVRGAAGAGGDVRRGCGPAGRLRPRLPLVLRGRPPGLARGQVRHVHLFRPRRGRGGRPGQGPGRRLPHRLGPVGLRSVGGPPAGRAGPGLPFATPVKPPESSMSQTPDTPRRRPLALAAVLAAVLALGAGPGPFAGEAQAQTAARVESQTRPNFGLLLDPPARSRARAQHRRWDYRSHHRGRDWRPDHRPYPPRLEEVVLVDCGGNPGSGALESAVARVAPGGTLILRARGGACVGW